MHEDGGIDPIFVEGFTTSPIPKVVLGEAPDLFAEYIIERLSAVEATDIDAILSSINGVEDYRRKARD